MTRRYATGMVLTLLLGGLVLAADSPVSAQMGPGTMGGGIIGQGQSSAMPMQQMPEVLKQMADRLASGKRLEAEKAERLRRLTDQLVAATGRMSQGMGGGMMGGGMMGQGSEQMGEISRILLQISDLLRSQ